VIFAEQVFMQTKQKKKINIYTHIFLRGKYNGRWDINKCIKSLIMFVQLVIKRKKLQF
jgi:hypothetical protein